MTLKVWTLIKGGQEVRHQYIFTGDHNAGNVPGAVTALRKPSVRLVVLSLFVDEETEVHLLDRV